MTGDRPGVILALTPVAERAIEPWLFGEQAAVAPMGSVGEADELERDATAPGLHAVLISPSLSGLTTGHLERARAHGLRLVGIALDERDERALGALGVDAIVECAASADALLASIQDDVRRQAPAVPAAPPTDSAPDEQRGTALAVIGSKGAPGASECAASLALLASERWPTLLVELDLLGGGVDVRIGADPHAGSIVGLIRAAASDGEPLAELVERWVTCVPGWPPVLLAPADSEDALELAQPGAITAALRALQSQMPLTVCDVGALLSTGGSIAAPARAHREALVTADAVLLVLGARDGHLRPGLAQFDRLTELGIPPERLRVIVNGAGGPGAASERQLDDTLVPRLAERGLTADAWLAWDQRALDRARRKSIPIAAARRRGRYARVLAHLLDELFLPTAPTPRRRKHKLVAPATPTENEKEEVALSWRR